MNKDKILRSDVIVPESKFNVAGAYIWDKLSKLDDQAICMVCKLKLLLKLITIISR